MPHFLFSATDPNGNAVKDNVESGNLSQARYKLEIRGYTDIEFIRNELSADVNNLFEEGVSEALLKNPELQAAFMYDASSLGFIKLMLKLTAIIWIPFTAWIIWAWSPWSFAASGIFWAAFVYITLPTIVYNEVLKAVSMARQGAGRFWIGVAKALNKISKVKIPDAELDMRSSCLDAMNGDLSAAMKRMSKYRDDPKVSRRLHLSHLYTLNEHGRNYDEALKYQAMSLDEGNDFPEELLDHAMMLARRKKEIAKARELISRALEKETSVLISALVPLAQGIVEVEGGNYELGEFYLTESQKRLEPFKNAGLIGPISELKAYLSVVLRSKGETEEADRLFAAAKPYLLAHQDNQLLEFCA